ncbi:MAG: hypothetical protein ACE5FY_00610 [Nitrospiria bacterium]
MKKGKKAKLQEDALGANRWGCGCVVLALFGLVIAMIVSAFMQK